MDQDRSDTKAHMEIKGWEAPAAMGSASAGMVLPPAAPYIRPTSVPGAPERSWLKRGPLLVDKEGSSCPAGRTPLSLGCVWSSP